MGTRRVPNGLIQFKSARKIGLCSNCSQILDECTLARGRKIFARIFVKIPLWQNGEILGKNARAMNVSGNISFILVLLTFY